MKKSLVWLRYKKVSPEKLEKIIRENNLEKYGWDVWYDIVTTQYMPKEMILKYLRNLDVKKVIEYQYLDAEFALELVEKVKNIPHKVIPGAITFTSNVKLSEEFLRKHKDHSLIDWDVVVEKFKMSSEFIDEMNEYIDFKKASIYQKLDTWLIEKYENEVDWDSVSEYQKLSENFIEKYQGRLNWFKISKYQVLSEKFIKKFELRVDWKMISRYQKMSKEFILENSHLLDLGFLRHNPYFWDLMKTLPVEEIPELFYRDPKTSREEIENYELEHEGNVGRNIKEEVDKEIDMLMKKRFSPEDLKELIKNKTEENEDFWKVLIKYQYLPKEIIALLPLGIKQKYINEIVEYQDLSLPEILKFQKELGKEVSWVVLSESVELPENFIRENKSKVVWELVIKNQKLSPKFIDEMSEYFNSDCWELLCKYQDLPEWFIEKYWGKMDPSLVCQYQKLSVQFIQKYEDKLDWFILSTYQELNEELIEKHIEDINWEAVSEKQNISLEFIGKYKENLNFYKLLVNKYVQNQLKDEKNRMIFKLIFSEMNENDFNLDELDFDEDDEIF